MKTQKFKANFTIPTSDLKNFESKELTVNSNIPEDEQLFGDPEFKISIPDFMFKELADTEPQFDTEPDINKRKTHESILGLFGEREITRKFKKTQTAKLISILQDYMIRLSEIIVDRHSLETATKTKKIFIKFTHDRKHHTNGLNNAYRGETIYQSFNYFVGYEIWTEKTGIFDDQSKPKKKYITHIGYASKHSSIQHYNTHFKEDENIVLDLPGLNQSIKRFEEEFTIIDWTQEREDFCKKIKETFDNVNKELSYFLTNINNETIESLMASNNLKILNA